MALASTKAAIAMAERKKDKPKFSDLRIERRGLDR